MNETNVAETTEPDRFPHPEAASRLRTGRRRSRLSLREYLGLVTILMLIVALAVTGLRLRDLRREVGRLRSESGYLSETSPVEVAAARAPSDQPLTYRVRIRTPEGKQKYRVAYSSLWPRDAAQPQWYGAVPVPPGESLVTIRILEDPRDGRWKIATLVGSEWGNKRMATVLPKAHTDVFRGSHQVISTGVGRETFAVDQNRAIRLLDERWLVGEGSLLLYGDRAPENDQIGIYAELQPDTGPL